MSPPGYSNGNGHQVDPLGAEHAALIAAVARGVAKLEAAERSFNATAKTLVKDSKETREELAELKGAVLRIEAQGKESAATLAKLVSVVGAFPEAVDPAEELARLQTQSVQDMTVDQVVEREKRIRSELEQRKQGTGLCGLVARGVLVDHAQSAAISKGFKAKALVGGGILLSLAGLVTAWGGGEGIAQTIDAAADGAAQIITAVRQPMPEPPAD